MKKILIFLFALSATQSFAQADKRLGATIDRPKLVVGLMVDQMRWDYLYRYYDRYKENGFKRLLQQGFSCENTMIPYAQTLTAAGHACVYTGSVPAINGIMGNEWYDRSLGRTVYCVEDDSVKVIGGAPNAEPMSPRNLAVTTICDELRLATNFQSKVIGIALKDRGGILPAGHSANAAYWYDPATGNWVSSTYYMKDIPAWVKSFNGRKMVDSLYKLNWNTLYPINTYKQSDEDAKAYEGRTPVFPHITEPLAGKNYQVIAGTPYGNTLTLEFAKNALLSEDLGKDAITDFLAVSLSSPDYVGHQYGPNSIEQEDTYLRLDQELAAFFDFLDARVGKGNYLFFISADHAVAHVPGFLKEHNLPGGLISTSNSTALTRTMNKFKMNKLILSFDNYQFYLDDKAIDSAGAKKEDVKKYLIEELNKESNLYMAFDTEEISEVNLPAEVKEMFIKGFHPKLGGEIQIIPKAGYFFGAPTGTTHGTWYPYDAHIPLVWMGWGITPGKTNREVHMTDVACTIAAMLHIQMPSGSIGKVIEEITAR